LDEVVQLVMERAEASLLTRPGWKCTDKNEVYEWHVAFDYVQHERVRTEHLMIRLETLKNPSGKPIYWAVNVYKANTRHGVSLAAYSEAGQGKSLSCGGQVKELCETAERMYHGTGPWKEHTYSTIARARHWLDKNRRN